MSGPDTRDLTAAQCDAAMPTSRALYGDSGPQLWVLADGDAVAGMPRPGRYVRRGPPEEPAAGPYWIREGQT